MNNKVIEQNLDYIKKVTWEFYKRYEMSKYYEYEDTLQEVILYLLQTMKYFNKLKSKDTTFLYMQINNKCLRLLNDTKKESKKMNYDNDNRVNNEVYSTNGFIDFIENLVEDNDNLEMCSIDKITINNYIKMFKNDELKLKIIYLLTKGLKRKEICKILGINIRKYDWQRIAIKKQIEKIM